MYKYILFDLDGTLTDPQEGITKCFQYALEKCGISEDRENLLRVIGPPLIDSFKDFYNMNEEDANKGVKYYRERFETIGLFENKAYDGIHKVLKTLVANGYILAVATSKPTVFSVRILEKYDLARFFKVVVGSGMDDGTLNTKAKVIFEVLRQLNISKDMYNEVLMVGDRKHDIIGSKECGIDSLGVYYGFAEAGELEEAGANYIVKDMDELLKFFE